MPVEPGLVEYGVNVVGSSIRFAANAQMLRTWAKAEKEPSADRVYGKRSLNHPLTFPLRHTVPTFNLGPRGRQCRDAEEAGKWRRTLDLGVE